MNNRTSREDHFKLAIDLLASRPQLERDAVTAFLLRWFDLPHDIRAALVRVVWTDARDVDVARVVGVNRSTLGNYERYKRVKPTVAEFGPIKQRGSKRRKSTKGTWPLIDSPE